MIKKLVISGYGSSESKFKLWGIGLTIPIDGVWTEQWLIGHNVTTRTYTNYVCDELDATTSLPSTNTSVSSLNGLFKEGTREWLAFGKSDLFEVTITFTKPITAVKNVFYRFYATPDYYINGFKGYDESDNLLFSSDVEWTKVASSTDYTVNYLETPGLETTKIYQTNKLGTVETTDVCHITDIYSIDIINPVDVVLDNTDIRYLLSFDGRNTYKSYDATIGGWVTVSTTDIMTQGLTSSELLALRSSEYLLAVDTNYRTLDILVGLITTDEIRTPCVNSIRVSYYKITT